MEEGIRPCQSSVFAKEGHVAHFGCEFLAKNPEASRDKLNAALLAEWINQGGSDDGKVVNQEMHDSIRFFVNYVKDIEDGLALENKPFMGMTEVKTDYSDVAPDGFGTVDRFIIADDIVHVIDFKYGKGIKVSAYENSQLMLYAYGLLKDFGHLVFTSEIRLHIVQPRCGQPSYWDVSIEQLNKWATEFVKPRAALAFRGGGTPTPGDHCQFCKVYVRCPSNKKMLDDVMNKSFGDEPAEAVTMISEDELVEAYQKMTLVTKWLNAVKTYMYNELINGREIPGYKLVSGRATRYFTDEMKVLEILEEEFDGEVENFMRKPELLPLTNIEKNLGKKRFTTILSPYVDKRPGSPTIAPESDKREAISLNDIDSGSFGDDEDNED